MFDEKKSIAHAWYLQILFPRECGWSAHPCFLIKGAMIDQNKGGKNSEAKLKGKTSEAKTSEGENSEAKTNEKENSEAKSKPKEKERRRANRQGHDILKIWQSTIEIVIRSSIIVRFL